MLFIKNTIRDFSRSSYGSSFLYTRVNRAIDVVLPRAKITVNLINDLDLVTISSEFGSLENYIRHFQPANCTQ